MATILCVDDSRMVRRLLQVVLTNAGHTALDASSGEDCLSILSREMPDLVLLDLMMPTMDGLETLSRIRARPGLADLPVLMLSGDSSPGSIAAAMAHGARGFLAKPFDQHVLRQRVLTELATTEQTTFRRLATDLLGAIA